MGRLRSSTGGSSAGGGAGGKQRLESDGSGTGGSSGSKRGRSTASGGGLGGRGRVAAEAGAGGGGGMGRRGSLSLLEEGAQGPLAALASLEQLMTEEGEGGDEVVAMAEPVVVSLESLNANVLSVVLGFLSAAEAERLAAACHALRTQSGYRGFVPFFRLRAPGGNESLAARHAARRRRRIREQQQAQQAADADGLYAQAHAAASPRRRVVKAEEEVGSLLAAAATPPRPGPPLPPPLARSLSSTSSASFSSSTASTPPPSRHRRRLSGAGSGGCAGSPTPSHHGSPRSSPHSHKPPLPPYKQALATLRARAYPRLEALHLDLRRLTRKDLMALVDKLPPTLQELHLSHSLPPLTTTPHGADDLGAAATTGAGALGIEAGLGPLDDDGGISIGSTQGALLPVGVTLLPSLSFLPSPHDAVEAEAEEAAWAEEQEAARATTATPGATAHMVGAYLRLGQSCKGLRVLALPRQRFDLPSGTLALLTTALGSGCWPQLESLDVSLDLLALDGFAGPALLQEGSPRGLRALTLRLLFRPDQEDVDAEVNGEGLAQAVKEGRLRRLESLALLPDELRFGEGNEEEGVAVADMVWVATDAFHPVFEAMTPEPSATTTAAIEAATVPCPKLQALALGEFLSPPTFAALNRFLRAGSVLPPSDTATDAPTAPTTARVQVQSPMKHLRLGRLNGDELAAQLMELAGLVRDGHLAALETLHINDLSSTERSRQGRVEPLRVMIEEGIKKRRSLPRLRSLSLRNSGVTSADAEDVILHAPPTLAALSLGNESEILIYNFNCVGWPALRTLRKAAAATISPPTDVLPALTSLNLHGNRLSPYGATQLAAALAKGAMPNLRTLDLRGTHMGAAGLTHLLKGLSRLNPAPGPGPTTSTTGTGTGQGQEEQTPATVPTTTTTTGDGSGPAAVAATTKEEESEQGTQGTQESEQEQEQEQSPAPPALPPSAPSTASSVPSLATAGSISAGTNSNKKRKRAKRGRLTMPRRTLRATGAGAGGRHGAHANGGSAGGTGGPQTRSASGGEEGVGTVRALALRRLMLGISGGGSGEEKEKEEREQKRALLGLVQSPALPQLTRLILWDEDETLDAAAVAALQAANPRVRVTVHARLVAAPPL